MDASQLAEKARELHQQILRLEGEKYDLEKRFKQLQVEVSADTFTLRHFATKPCGGSWTPLMTEPAALLAKHLF